MMMSRPDIWHALMTKLSEVTGNYLLAQARAGAHVLQMFDSWVGDLSPYDYERCVLPYSRRALEIAGQAGVPLIHFGTSTSGMLKRMQAAGGDVIGVDWRIDLAEAWALLGDGVGVQGNLDPAALFADKDALTARASTSSTACAAGAGTSSTWGTGFCRRRPSTTCAAWSISSTNTVAS